MDLTRRTQRVAGWIIVAISLVHLTVSFIDYDEPSLRAMWFVGSGIALMLIGGLNVVTAYVPTAILAQTRELHALTMIANILGAFLGILYVVLTGGTMPQGPVLVVLFLVAAWAQLRRRPTEEPTRSAEIPTQPV